MREELYRYEEVSEGIGSSNERLKNQSFSKRGNGDRVVVSEGER